MKRKKRIIRMLAAVLAASVLGSWGVPARAAGPAQVTVTVDGADVTPLAGARRVGTNIEMSMISDAMWQANGNWMEQSFFAGELDMMRWGYDAWAFDWEQEMPLSENRYWGGLNSRDAAGSFGLREFIRFCKQQDIVPFVMIPIESLDAFGGQAGLEKVKALTASMAQYIAQEGIELCYFDMGNEPWNNGAGGVANARYLGSLFPEFQQIVKAANPNYRLVLQRAPENILWNSWNSALVSAAQGAFDAYDDHRYAFYGWNKYFDKNSDALLEPGTPIEGKEGILGECNIGWTPVQDDWNAGHVRDMGGSMALLNAMLEMIGDGRYSRIVTWPSHYPSKASISGCPENAFGWFDLDQWYLEGKTVRLTGPAAAHRIVNQNVLENRLGASSSAEKVRVYAYCNAAQTDLRVIVLNKWDATQLTGTGAKLYGLRGNWCGMADAQVDFGAPVRIDAYAGTTQEQALLFDTGELPYGEHTVTLTVAGEKNEASSDAWIEFDKVELSDSQNGAPVINKVVWNDENPNLKKFSVWKHQSVPGSYHDDDSSSNTWKAHIEFSFEGSNAVIYGLKGPWCGRAQITVDGAAAADIDAYAPEMMLQQVLYDTGTLEPGTHTVRITVKAEKSPESSGRWVEIDRVVWQ